MTPEPAVTPAESAFRLWTVPVEAFTGRGFDPFFELGALEASSYIEQLSSAGLLIERHLTGKVVDVCCGYGGSSFVLAKNSEHVTAVDLCQTCIDTTLNYTRRIIGNAVCADCVAYLKQQPPSSVDLITAFMFGPDVSGPFSQQFYNAAQHALKDDGRLLVTSDYETMGHFKNAVVENAGVFMALESPLHPFYIGGKFGSTNMTLPQQDPEILERLEYFVPKR